ncbi:hypothetical protein J7K24_03255 [bacterium]|nr:hypothetical protein [bacterium]
MQAEIKQRLTKVKQIIKDFDEFRVEYSQAKNKFIEGNKLLDECLEIINKEDFRVEELREISL